MCESASFSLINRSFSLKLSLTSWSRMFLGRSSPVDGVRGTFVNPSSSTDGLPFRRQEECFMERLAGGTVTFGLQQQKNLIYFLVMVTKSNRMVSYFQVTFSFPKLFSFVETHFRQHLHFLVYF